MPAPAMGLAEVLCAVGSGLLVSVTPGIFKRQGADPHRQLGLQLCGNALAANRPGEGHPLGLIGAGYVSGAAGLLAICGARRRKPAVDRRTWLLGALYAAASVGALTLFVRGLATSDAAEFAPVQAGAAVIFGTAWAVLRGERPSRLAYVGVGLAILAVALFSLGGRPLSANAPERALAPPPRPGDNPAPQ